MPTLIEEKEIRLEWTDISARKHKRPGSNTLIRSTGVHLSGVIKHVLTATGQLKPDDVTDEMPVRMAVGMAWEEWAVGLWANIKWQPGEVELDGVFGNPDGVTLRTPINTAQVDQLEEFKFTWKSMRDRQGVNILSEKLWMYQLYGYCRMKKLLRARLHILWANGDYRPPAPQYRTYLIGFGEEELEKFWANVVMTNKDSVRGEQND